MLKHFLLIGCIFAAMNLSAQTIEIPIWPDGAPESNGITAPETEDNGSYSNISVATMKVYPAVRFANTGKAILICPGGGYIREAARHEGTQFAEWFAANGITAFVLKYRLPNQHANIPLMDAQQAMRIIRSRAAEWNIRPDQIGVSGFSAGGHLASTLLTHFDKESRPDFGVLFYPVITMEGFSHAGSRENLLGKNPSQEMIAEYSNEKQIKEDTPPTLLLLSDDDKSVVPENSIRFYHGLKEKGIHSAMYIFPSGGHGWGFRSGFRYHEPMKQLVLDWIYEGKGSN